MKQVLYVTARLLTTDAIAAALLDYAKALAVAGRSDTVEIPTVDTAGGVRMAELLIGPTSDLLTVDVAGSEADMAEAAETLQELAERTSRLLLSPRDELEELIRLEQDSPES